MVVALASLPCPPRQMLDQEVAQYLWDNYLGGTSANRPLGSAFLDGINFDISEEATTTKMAWQNSYDVQNNYSRQVKSIV